MPQFLICKREIMLFMKIKWINKCSVFRTVCGTQSKYYKVLARMVTLMVMMSLRTLPMMS